MLVSDVINFAVNGGEIANLQVADVSDSDPDKLTNEATLISYINQGVIELYTKFNLAHQSRTLSSVVDGAEYTMPDDYLYMIYAQDNNEIEIPINDEFADYSIFEPAPYTVIVEKDDQKYIDSTTIYLTYVAVPPLLTATSDTVPLTYAFLQPLLKYMAYKANTPTDNDMIANAQSNPHYIAFLGACNEVRREGRMTADNQSNYKHDTRGFGESYSEYN